METLPASRFKATCLEWLDRIDARALDRLVITKRGRPVAALVPIETPAEGVARLHGFLRGQVEIPPGLDLTAPTRDESEFEAACGKLP